MDNGKAARQMSVKVPVLRKDCSKNNHSILEEWEGNEITSRKKMFISAKREDKVSGDAVH